METITGQSFTATLHATAKVKTGPVTSAGGWLQIGESNSTPVSLRFNYVDQVNGVCRYTITRKAKNPSDDGAKLGVSRNGYFGFYQVAEVVDLWLVTLVGDPADNRLVLTLADAEKGKATVAKEVIRGPGGTFWETFHYLCAGGTIPLTLHATITR